MPINHEVKGDLVELAQAGLFDAIIHGCNCFCAMGSGVAKDIRRVFPEAYDADLKTVRGNEEKLGTYTAAYISRLGIYVVNLYTQYNTAKYPGELVLDYEALERGFRELNRHLMIGIQGKYKIGIPKIGCGLAGGDWEKVQEIINRCTPDLDIIYVEYTG